MILHLLWIHLIRILPYVSWCVILILLLLVLVLTMLLLHLYFHVDLFSLLILILSHFLLNLLSLPFNQLINQLVFINEGVILSLQFREEWMFWSLIFYSFSSLIFLYIQLNLFFTLFSVLFFNYLTISDHLFPICYLSWRIWRSSLALKGSLLMSGFKKLYHLSLHCLPFL